MIYYPYLYILSIFVEHGMNKFSLFDESQSKYLNDMYIDIYIFDMYLEIYIVTLYILQLHYSFVSFSMQFK